MKLSAIALRRLGMFAAAGALFILPEAAFAKATCPAGFPSKPIRFVVGFEPARRRTDLIGRAIAQGMESSRVGPCRPRTVRARAAAWCWKWLKTQPADGYTVGITSTDAMTVNHRAQRSQLQHERLRLSRLGHADLERLLPHSPTGPTRPFSNSSRTQRRTAAPRHCRSRASTGSQRQATRRPVTRSTSSPFRATARRRRWRPRSAAMSTPPCRARCMLRANQERQDGAARLDDLQARALCLGLKHLRRAGRDRHVV